MPPKLIGPYHVLETLGAGGVGTVYRALDRRTNEEVALKLLSSGPALDPQSARRLAREFEALSELSHPNVVKVFDTGVYQGYPYLAMELVEGLTLRQYLSLRSEELASSGELRRSLRERPPGPRRVLWEDSIEATEGPATAAGIAPFDLAAFGEEMPSEELSVLSGPDSLRALADVAGEPDTDEPGEPPGPEERVREEQAPPAAPRAAPRLEELNRPERVARLKDSMLQLCQALAYIHGHGLVHRDLKPSNIMVDEDRQVRLMDFGLAKYLADDSAVTASGRLVGTFRYMAPEQILGEPLDGRADLYSLGVILYELLCGRPPYDAPTPYDLWQKVLETEATPLLALNTNGDLQLARVAHRLIRKEPDDRFQTAEEVFEALSE